jgi:hypothetical protein
MLVLLPLGLVGCLVTSSLDDLKGGSVTCDATHADCDGIASNGCETDVTTSALHCGSCKNACPQAPSAAPECVAGTCTIACDVVAANCDDSDANGCETPIEKDPNNCGECKHACGDENTSSRQCTNGKCVLECLDGYASCDGSDETGCETWLDETAHCGKCGRSCLAVACASKDCPTSASLDNATAMAVAKGVVYVATTDESCSASPCTYTRHFRAVSDGEIQDLFDPSADVTDIALDANGVLYLASTTGISAWDPSSSTAPAQLSSERVESVEVDAELLYFRTRPLALPLEKAGLYRLPLSSGAAEKITEVDDGWNPFGARHPIALGGSTLYYHTAKPTEGIYAIPKTGGIAELIQATPNPSSLAADANAVYWSLETEPGNVYRASAGEVSVLVTSQTQPTSLATDGTELWWWNAASGSLVRSKTDGSAVTTLHSQSASNALVTFDVDAVYWLTTAGQLNRLAR